MTNNGAISKTITPSASTQSYTIPKGYHNGSGKVTVNAASNPFNIAIAPGYRLIFGWNQSEPTYASGKSFTFISNRQFIIVNITGKGYTKVAFSNNLGGGAYVIKITTDGTRTTHDVTSLTLNSSAAFLIICGRYSNTTEYTVTFS